MTLHLTRFDDVRAFYEHVWSYLLQHEAEHNVMLGLRQNILRGVYAAPVYMACVENANEIVAVVLRTPPHQVNISRVSNLAALPLIAADLHQHFGTLPSVGGAPDVTEKFAEIWSGMTGQAATLRMGQGIYQLSAVKPPVNIPGELHIATENHCQIIMDWVMAFEAEALGGIMQREEAERITQMRIPSQPERGFRVWCDAGKVVSMAGYTGPTPNGIRINAVYTPPELRGRGYASACVAALSQEMLDGGRRFCFLYTDLANPTSNKIYQNIGYEHVCNAHLYVFE